MLKLTYSNTDVLLEHLDQSLEAVITQRSLVAVRAGLSLAVQPSYASFPLPMDLPGLKTLRANAQGRVELCPCDDDWLEVTLRGTWVSDSATGEEGILMVELGPSLEQQLVDLWQRSRLRRATPCPQGR
jgi:hypothetical protein